MSLPALDKFGLVENPLLFSPFVQNNVDESAFSNMDFLLLDGSFFLLLDGENLLLL